MIFKRKYGKIPGVDAQYYTPVRNKILNFISGKGKVSIPELNKFFKSINIKSGRNTSMNWIYRNRKLVQGVRGKKKEHLFMLTQLGKKILLRTNTYENLVLEIEDILELDGAATLANTPGMGNSQLPSMGEIGSGDTFDAVGSPGEEEEEENEFIDEAKKRKKVLVTRRSKEDRSKKAIINVNQKIQKYIKDGSRGSLDLSGTIITELPDNLKIVRGDLNLEGTQIKKLPDGLEVSLSLYLSGTPIEILPKGLKVRSLDLTGTSIKKLPDDLEVDDEVFGAPQLGYP